MTDTTPSPRLPQELIDSIILDASEDKPTLEAFQYVSKACLHTARSHIFAKRTLRLQRSYSFDDFGEDLKEHLHLAEYITDLHVTSTLTWFNGGYRKLTSLGPHGDSEEGNANASGGEPPVLSTHIIPDSLFDLLPRLRALSVSKVWVVLPAEAQRASVKTADGPHDDTYNAEPSKKVHLNSLKFRNVTLWEPVDYTLSHLLDRFKPAELALEGINRGSWESAYPAHNNTLLPPSPIVYPIYLTLDATMMRRSYMEILQRLTSPERLRNLKLTDVGNEDDVPGLGTYLAAARNTLVEMYVYIWGIKYEGVDPWPRLHLPSFTSLHAVTVKIPIIGSSTTKMGYIWKAFFDFLRYLPTQSLRTFQLILEPDCSFLGGIKGVLGRIPQSVKTELDPLFERLLPTLEQCEFVWTYQVGGVRLKSIDEPYNARQYISDICGLVPSLNYTGVLRTKMVAVPAPEIPHWNDSDWSDSADDNCRASSDDSWGDSSDDSWGDSSDNS
ncbi:hypothetical protein K474DRAFT_1665147 [Panus rudis PR-1116 ss-1]|nr:hypothetical protein K474DRAFT_1665147 [Panus rudis PR-1116 ss-1]